ncbi:MAG: MlaD family protein [Campylobacterota bacterium]|nr:MlaD family protein [Campylobacterota bacterium]
MNNRVNYTVIGFLVLFGLILMLVFSYWLLKPSAEDETKKYNIHFDESVLGLNLDAPVKYRGINVGKVSQLRINPKNSEQVEVLITILKSTPIKSSTRAKLTSQGITGLSYINLSLGDNGAPALVAKEGEIYPLIKTEPSFFERFEKSLDTVSTKLSKTLTRTTEVLNDENQKQFALVLKRAAGFMDKMERLLSDDTVKHFHSSMKNLDSASAKLDTMVPKIESFIDKSVAWEDKISTSFASIMNSYLGIKSSMDEIKRAVSSGEFNVKEIAGDVVPTLNNTLLGMQHLMIRIETTLEQYERSPSDILYKQESIKKGPGER